MKKNIYSILLGIGAGVIMALIMLYCMITAGFMMQGTSFWLCVIVAAALPLCLRLFPKSAFRLLLSQILMVAVSFVISVIYCFYVAHASAYVNTVSQGMHLSLVLHAISMICVIVSALLVRKRNEK